MVGVALQLAGDPAAAVFIDGSLRFAVRDCVLTRRRPVDGFPSAALDAVLAAASVATSVVGLVVVTGLGRPGLRARVRGALAGLGPPRASGEVRLRHHAAAVGPVSAADLAVALDRARLAHAERVVVAEAEAIAIAPPDTGRAGAVLGAARKASGCVLPDTPFCTPPFSDQAAYRALSNAGLPRVPTADPDGAARGLLAAREPVVWANGAAAFGERPLGPRRWCRPGHPDTLLLAPDGLPAHSPVDVVAAWRALGGTLILGNYVVDPIRTG